MAVYNSGRMKISTTARIALSLSSGLALALAYPSYKLPLLGWIAPAMLIFATLGATPQSGALLGFLQGVIYFPVSLAWIYEVLRQFGPLTPLQAAGVMAAISVAGSAFHAVFGASVAWVSRKNVGAACVLAPFLWVAQEFARMHLPDVGFPWNLLGYTASGNLALVQITTVTGIFGLSWLVAAYNALLAWMAVDSFTPKRGRAAAIWAGATAVLVTIAWAGPRWVPRAQADHVAHLMQTDFPQSMSYPADWMQIHAGELDELARMSVSAAQRAPGLVVWPEVPAPFSLQDPRFAARAEEIARDAGHGFLVGEEDWKRLPNGSYGNVTNSAALLDPRGNETFLYDKIHLVPFGEYVPWRRWLTFTGRMTADIGDFHRGSEYTVGKTAGGRFGVFICYESIFPNEVRQFTRNGAELLVNISNDGWFGRDSAPAQHVAMARVRAVENRRWLLRDTNNGFTVSVDPYGRTVASLAPDIRGQLDAPYGFRSDLTLYTRYGDWIAWMSILAAVVIFLMLGFRRKQTPRAELS